VRPTTSGVRTVQRALVTSIRGVLAEEASLDRQVARLAATLRLFLGHPDLLHPEERAPSPAKYRQHVLHGEEDGSFSISSLVWLPGQSTSVHDHLCWGVMGVHQGTPREDHYRVEEAAGGEFLVPGGGETLRFGDVATVLPPGDIHSVTNPGSEVAISIHVYGADVRRTGTSIRRRYDLPIRPAWVAAVA
jgi:predicted metal-dependent enzyme (double-stranded beta helix superfamily)